MNLLYNLYKIHSPSGLEYNMTKFIMSELDKFGVAYKVDTKGQIYSFTDKSVLFSAHIDQVIYSSPCTFVDFSDINHVKGYDCLHNRCNLGADDKNGVYILLKLLNKFKNNISFIFSTEEEMGGNIKFILDKNYIDIYSIKYAIILDRKGSHDIIGYMNNYCDLDFDSIMCTVGYYFGYTTTDGFISDANVISNYINCVNISVGYYNNHTRNEYSSLTDITNSLAFATELVNYSDEIYEMYYEYVGI